MSGMDDELEQLRKKKMAELMQRKAELSAPKAGFKPIVIEVFTSPTCPHCPHALSMAKQVALKNPKVRVVEMSTATKEGAEKAGLYGVKAVPSIFINGMLAFVGAPKSIEELNNALMIGNF